MTVRSMDRSRDAQQAYDPTRWAKTRRFLHFLLRTAGKLLLKVDHVSGLENIPKSGPAILMINHIAWIDPFAVIQVSDRIVVPMGKVEAFHYPILGIIPRVWGAIPVRRDAVEPSTLRQALDLLRGGGILLVAPEGTRSPQLGRGLEGIAYLASRSGVPVVPVTLEHTEGFPTTPFSPRWRKPGALVRFGRPFCYRPEYKRAKREQLRKMTDEAMYILAAMLPEKRRGEYADLSLATQDTLRWLSDSSSGEGCG